MSRTRVTFLLLLINVSLVTARAQTVLSVMAGPKAEEVNGVCQTLQNALEETERWPYEDALTYCDDVGNRTRKDTANDTNEWGEFGTSTFNLLRIITTAAFPVTDVGDWPDAYTWVGICYGHYYGAGGKVGYEWAG